MPAQHHVSESPKPDDKKNPNSVAPAGDQRAEWLEIWRWVKLHNLATPLDQDVSVEQLCLGFFRELLDASES